MSNFFCFGFGQVAQSFVAKILSENIQVELSTTSRKPSKKNFFKNITYNTFNFTNRGLDKSLIKKLESAEHILISIPPLNNEDIILKNYKKFFYDLKLKPKSITYLSSTSVYGDYKGEWVNEKSNTNPSSSNGIARLKAENDWLNFSKEFDLPLQIFRLAGIYSNKNNILEKLKNNNVKIIKKNNQFFSRIHIEDIASILFNSLNAFKSAEIYNIADDMPSSYEEVIMYACDLLKIKKPEELKFEEITSQALKVFYSESKKVSNIKMKKAFNYNLKFPSYREGLTYIKNHFI